jgi:hypothetical protein
VVAENVVGVHQRGLQLLVARLDIVVVAVEQFLLRFKRRPLLFERCNRRELAAEILCVKVFLGGAVQCDFGAIRLVEILIPSGLAIGLIDVSCFAVNADLLSRDTLKSG